jgi:hypothetical protein
MPHQPTIVGRLPDQVFGISEKPPIELRQSRADDVVRVRLLQRVQRPLA